VLERPILFSGEMVSAILDGRKTVTRRVVKPQPANDWRFTGGYGRITSKHPHKDKFGVFIRRGEHTDFPEVDIIPCPYGQPGDRLWVRETWADVNLSGAPGIAYRADGDVRDLMEELSFLDDHGAFNYDDERVKGYHFAAWYEDLISGAEGRWRPSIHMPRWASRIQLEITAVRVERLHDISEEQAQAEGARPLTVKLKKLAPRASRMGFIDLWCSINGDESWDANPWVWVVEFEVIKGAQHG